MKYLVIFLFLVLLISGLSACEFKNVRHKIGITTKPFQKMMALKILPNLITPSYLE